METFNGYTYFYQGKRLVTVTKNNKTISYTYDLEGLIIKKRVTIEEGDLPVSTTTTNYYYDNRKLVKEVCGNNIIDYFYDENNQLYGYKKNNTIYFYIRDVLGNIIGILNNSGVIVSKFDYDAFGNIINQTGSVISNFRYKGYYYDTDIELYYLKTRFYNPVLLRFITPDSIEYLDSSSIIGLNLYAYCGNDPVNYKQGPAFSGGSITISSISLGGSAGNRISGNAVKPISRTLPSKFSGINLFGYELRTSSGWNTSPDIATGFFGRIGFSSYVAHTQGQFGMLYAFAGSTSDIMNWMGTTYYSGAGINLFDILGVEAYVETIGIGAQVSIGRFSFGADINLIGGTSITLGWNTDLGNGMTRTDGFTVGVNTGCLVAVIYWIYKFVTTGDPSPVPGLQPVY